MFGKVRGEEEEGGADGRDEVYLVGESNAGVVAEDFNGFLEAAGKVESVPFREILTEGVDVDNAVFYQRSIDSDVWVEVYSSTDGVL